MFDKQTSEKWQAHYARWEADCLEEFNERFGETRKYTEEPDCDYSICELVEFSDSGHAYPHGIGGTGFIPNAVTPWEQSKWFLPYSNTRMH